MSDSLFNRELSRGRHASCLLPRNGQGNFNNLHVIHFSLCFEDNTKNLTTEEVDIDISVTNIIDDSLGSLVIIESRLRNVFDGVDLGY